MSMESCVSGDAIDAEATRKRRAALRKQQPAEEFVFGQERAAYEARLRRSYRT